MELRRWDTSFGLIRIKKNQHYLDCKITHLGLEEILSAILQMFYPDVVESFSTYDNFFNSVKLVTTLKDKLVKATGAIRENRTEKCPLTSNEALKKQERRQFDFKTDTKNDVLVYKWNDNNVVNLNSNAAGVHPISKAYRYSSSEKKQLQIDQPFLIKLYNEHTGSVDRIYQNVSKYQIAIRGKKWY